MSRTQSQPAVGSTEFCLMWLRDIYEEVPYTPQCNQTWFRLQTLAREGIRRIRADPERYQRWEATCFKLLALCYQHFRGTAAAAMASDMAKLCDNRQTEIMNKSFIPDYEKPYDFSKRWEEVNRWMNQESFLKRWEEVNAWMDQGNFVDSLKATTELIEQLRNDPQLTKHESDLWRKLAVCEAKLGNTPNARLAEILARVWESRELDAAARSSAN